MGNVITLADRRRKLSPHFTLGELIATSHRTINNTPSPEVIERLEVLASMYLEAVRARFGPLIVSSGFRCHRLNRKIKGARNSAHKYGCAADFSPLPSSGITTTEIVAWIVAESGLGFDQVIDEHSSTATWVHLGLTRPGFKGPRREALTMRTGKYFRFFTRRESTPFVGAP